MIVSETPWRLIWFSIAVLSPVALVAIGILAGIARELLGRAYRRAVARVELLRTGLTRRAEKGAARVTSIQAATARPAFESIPS